jgi:hypothetical protein
MWATQAKQVACVSGPRVAHAGPVRVLRVPLFFFFFQILNTTLKMCNLSLIDPNGVVSNFVVFLVKSSLFIKYEI